jgi:hypothetical protein
LATFQKIGRFFSKSSGHPDEGASQNLRKPANLGDKVLEMIFKYSEHTSIQNILEC